MNEKIDVWDNCIPSEKSNYINQNDVIIYNQSNFELEGGKPTMIDLFCGAGGFSVGCKLAGFQSILGIDWFEPAIKTWKYNHPKSLAILGDIKKIAPKYLTGLLKTMGINKVNLVTGGVPCQGFSRANRKHNDDDERNYLFRDYMKIVEWIQPDYIIIENVSGMQDTAGGKFVDDILQNMMNLNYNPTVKLLNAADYGVPQIRKRLIFVGIKKGKGLPEKFIYPEPTHIEKTNQLNSYSISKLLSYRTVKDAISDLPEIKSDETAYEYTKEAITDYQKIMRGLDDKINLKKSSKLFNHIAPQHPQKTIDKIDKTVPGKPMYDKFKQRIRLNWDKPSPTQLAGGIRPQFQFGHPSIPRGLTIRERARIQSFPDCYEFLGGTVQERVQTGNAVPPLLVYAIAKEIAKILMNTTTQYQLINETERKRECRICDRTY